MTRSKKFSMPRMKRASLWITEDQTSRKNSSQEPRLIFSFASCQPGNLTSTRAQPTTGTLPNQPPDSSMQKTAPEQGAMLREASRREHRQNRKTRFGNTRPCEGRLPRPLATPCDRHLLCIPSAEAGPPKAKRRSEETCKDQIWDSETRSGQEFRIKPKGSVRRVARPPSANHSEQPPTTFGTGGPR